MYDDYYIFDTSLFQHLLYIIITRKHTLTLFFQCYFYASTKSGVINE